MKDREGRKGSPEEKRSISNRETFVTGNQRLYLEALHQGLSPEEMKARFPNSKRNALHKQKIIDNVLDYYHMGEGELSREQAMQLAIKLGIEQGFLKPKEEAS